MTEAACLGIPLAAYPGFNRFTLDWLAGNPNATQFLPRTNAERTPTTRDAMLAEALIASNRNWGRNVEDEVARWAGGETFTVIAGQQVGFAGGPIYTLAKLAGMLKLKRDNEARGIPTTVFFWLATEDHDFAEVATLSLPKRDPKQQLDLTTFHARHPNSKMAVGALPVPEELTNELIEFLDIPRPSWLREGITFRDSFAELITSAVEGKFILVDALLPELRRAGAPLFDNILGNWDRIQRALDVRAEALTKAGYAPQVGRSAHAAVRARRKRPAYVDRIAESVAAARADLDVRVDASAVAGFRTAPRSLRRRAVRGCVLRADRAAARAVERRDAARCLARARAARAEAARTNGRSLRHQSRGDLRRN
jgi:hypothetical protein